jgi:hypothetical protein
MVFGEEVGERAVNKLMRVKRGRRDGCETAAWQGFFLGTNCFMLLCISKYFET